MQLNLEIGVASKQEWIDTVMADFNTFLQDHADCERKASSMAMSFVAKYPNRVEIIPELIETAVEELEHFQQVYALMEKRGVELPARMTKDLYVERLIKQAYSDPERRFMDRLLIASVLETRGAERFKMVADALTEPELKRFYKMLWTSEAKHGHIFVKMAMNYFNRKDVYDRLHWWIDREAEVIDGLEIRAALH